jgi:hypothetical protein
MTVGTPQVLRFGGFSAGLAALSVLELDPGIVIVSLFIASLAALEARARLVVLALLVADVLMLAEMTTAADGAGRIARCLVAALVAMAALLGYRRALFRCCGYPTALGPSWVFGKGVDAQAVGWVVWFFTAAVGFCFARGVVAQGAGGQAVPPAATAGEAAIAVRCRAALAAYGGSRSSSSSSSSSGAAPGELARGLCDLPLLPSLLLLLLPQRAQLHAFAAVAAVLVLGLLLVPPPTGGGSSRGSGRGGGSGGGEKGCISFDSSRGGSGGGGANMPPSVLRRRQVETSDEEDFDHSGEDEDHYSDSELAQRPTPSSSMAPLQRVRGGAKRSISAPTAPSMSVFGAPGTPMPAPASAAPAGGGVGGAGSAAAAATAAAAAIGRGGLGGGRQQGPAGGGAGRPRFLPTSVRPANTARGEIGGSDCWSEPDGTAFNVRGATYLSDHVKVASPASVMRHIGLDVRMSVDGSEEVQELRSVGAHPHVQAMLADWAAAEQAQRAGAGAAPLPFVFILNFLLPTGNLVAYWTPTSTDATPDAVTGGAVPRIDALFRRFVERPGDKEADAFRSARLKFVPNVVEGNFLLRKTAGNKPALIGKKMTQLFHAGGGSAGVPRYFEVTIDIGSSSIARSILGVACGYTKQLTLDMVLIVQGESPEELPEQVLAACRFHKLDLGRYSPLPPI